ncbi:MAG TPA: hypothetical protein VER08_06875 [Pyrinomonadaceae bacterium]|nr:hypothetical protein [Pyrinomonadaceae bacterium]
MSLNEPSKRRPAALAALTLSLLLAGCSGDNTDTANNNTGGATAQTASGTSGGATTASPDDSTIDVTSEPDLVIETRTFRDPNSRVERVVVTTRGGRRTARVYYRDNEVRELPADKVEQALTASSDAIVSFGGEVADKAEDVGGAAVDKTKAGVNAVGDKAEDVGDAAKKGLGVAADKTEDAAGKVKDAGGAVADKAKDGAKEVGKGAKKVGGKLKDAVTP